MHGSQGAHRSSICRPPGRPSPASSRASSATRKITLVDAPVSGGVAGAKAGTLAVMVSCPKATYAAGRADPQDVRQAVLHRREAGPRADRQARQQPAGRRGHGGLVGGAGDGRQGRHRSAGDDRHHQCRQRPQQRHAGQVPALDPARHLRFRLRHRALLQGRAAVRRRGRGARRADGGGRGRAPDAGRDECQVRAAVRLHAHRQGGGGMGRRRDPLAAQGQQQGRRPT